MKKKEKTKGEEFEDFLEFTLNNDTRITNVELKKKYKKISSNKKKDKLQF